MSSSRDLPRTARSIAARASRSRAEPSLRRHGESTTASRLRPIASIVPGGIVAQFRQAFGNLLTVLRSAGGIPGDLVSITIYLTDIPDYQAHGKEIGRVWRELAGPVYPAMAGIGTTALWQPEAMIEILGVAVIPESRLVVPRVVTS